jgi:hypothetical protein
MKLTIGLALSLGLCGVAQAAESWEKYLDQVRIKKAIADQLTPEQLQERKVRLAKWLEERDRNRSAIGVNAGDAVRAPGNTCPAATNEVGALPYGPVNDTTTGGVDDYDLAVDTTAPTCTATPTCVGAPSGTGSSYTGTGVGPDRAFRIRTDASCTLSVTMDPTDAADDLALIIYPATCSNNLTDCACLDDTGAGGTAETVTGFVTQANTDYFIVVDGYSTGGTPPGPDGPFTLSIAATAGTCALAGAGTPPTFTYTPAAASNVTFAPAGLVGSTANGTINVAVGTPGTGSGQAATTTITCTAPTAPFAGFGQTVTATGAGAITGGPLSGTCTIAAAPVNQTLTCTQNAGGVNTTLTWNLICPAGSLVQQIPVPAMSPVGRWTIVFVMLGLGLFAVALRKR